MELTSSDRRFKDWMSLIKIDIILTKKGLKNTDKVIDAVFKYLKRLKELGPQEWIFKEMNDIGDLNFKFLEKQTSPI